MSTSRSSAARIFALLGSNGAGKTTRRAHPVDVAPRRRGNGRSQRLRRRHGCRGACASAFSLTGQFAAVDEILTGRENLVLIAKLRHLDDPGAIADDLLRSIRADGCRRRRVVGTYSGGMRRRLDIAMSLIGEPPVIFLDEPTTGLDPQSRLEVWQTVTCARRRRHHGPAHHAIPRRGRAPRRPDRDPARGPDHRRRHARRAEAPAPAGEVEYVEKQPTLEEIFLAVTGHDRDAERRTRRHDHALHRRHRRAHRALPAPHPPQPRHDHHDRGHADRACMLLFVYVFGGAIDTGPIAGSYIDYMLPGILLITIASGIAYTSYRLFLDLKGGIFERFQSMPIARSSVLWAHVLTSLVANVDLARRRRRRRAAHRLPFRRGRAGLARRRRHPRAVHPGADLGRRDRRAVGQDGRRRERASPTR